MADNKQKKKIDRTRIDKDQAYELDYWTKKWSISPQQLRGAISATESTSVKKVEAYLKKKGKI